MKYLALTSFLIICFCSVSFGQNQTEKEQLVAVNFCDLIKNLVAYEGKTVRVTAIYRFGFEWADLYCPKCGLIRVTFEDFEEKTTAKRYRKLIKWSEAGKTLKVTFVGKIESKNSAEKQINVRLVEGAKLVSKSSSNYEFLPEKDKAKASCITESKQD